MNSAPRIEFDDLVLRLPISSDAEKRMEYGITKEFAESTGTQFEKIESFTYEDSSKWFDRIMNHPCKWIIEYKGIFIGAVSLRSNTIDNKCKFAIEIYDSKFQGLGIGSKVTRRILLFAFQEMKYHKVYLRVLESNVKAIKCYEKCGFKKEGVDREGAFINGKYESDVYMGILKPEFEVAHS